MAMNEEFSYRYIKLITGEELITLVRFDENTPDTVELKDAMKALGIHLLKNELREKMQ